MTNMVSWTCGKLEVGRGSNAVAFGGPPVVSRGGESGFAAVATVLKADVCVYREVVRMKLRRIERASENGASQQHPTGSDAGYLVSALS